MSTAVIYFSAIALVIGAAPMPYGYYILLRLCACTLFAYSSFISFNRKHSILVFVYGLFAIIFNPLIQIHFSKTIWIFIDISAAILLITTRNKIR